MRRDEIEIAVFMQKLVTTLHAEGRNDQINRFVDGGAALPQGPVMLSRAHSQFIIKHFLYSELA